MLVPESQRASQRQCRESSLQWRHACCCRATGAAERRHGQQQAMTTTVASRCRSCLILHPVTSGWKPTHPLGTNLPCMQVATVLVACVLAAMVATAGLGREPAFHVPASVAFPLEELPLCLLIGILCGAASALLGTVSRSTAQSFSTLRGAARLPAAVLPPLGGFACGCLALLCPEITYQVCKPPAP